MQPPEQVAWISNWKCSDVISQIEVSYDESTVAIATFSSESSCVLYLVSAVSGETLHKLHHNYPIADMKFCPADSSVIVTVSDHIRVFRWGNLSAVLNAHSEMDIVEICPYTSVDFEASKGQLFAVTDVRGFCSVWDLSAKDNDSPVQIYELVCEILYSVSFVTENVVGVVSESGSLFVIDRRTNSAVCTEAQDECVPACQPRILAWNHQSSLLAIANQTMGTFSVFEIKSVQDNPRLIGSSQRVNRAGAGIAALRWVETQSGTQVLVVVRDCGLVEVWNPNFGRLDAPVFEVNVGVGASALSYFWNKWSVVCGLINGHMTLTKLPDINNGRSGRKSLTGKFDDQIDTHYPTLA